MGRKGESISLSLKEYEKEALEGLAREYNMMWGDRPNISKLIKAIAQKKLLIAANHDWSKEKIERINKIRKILVDIGKIEEAKLIARILSSRSEVDYSIKNELENFLALDIPNWRVKLDNLIKRQQPFKIIYQDPSDRQWQHTILYARIELIEKRFYLLSRCQETEGNQDIEELQQNWSLRLDRIKDADFVEIDSQWEHDLQQIAVEFHLFDKLATAYEAKSQDIHTQLLTTDNGRVYKKVRRNIFSTFWFFREIAKYWQDCLIISPDTVRQKFINEKLQALNSLYEASSD